MSGFANVFKSLFRGDSATSDYLPVTPEVPVDPQTIGVPRAESFPQSGPVPWLDRPDAPQAIARKLKRGLITADQAKMCEQWVADGYLILPGFFGEERLDQAWAGYEKAISAGKLTPQEDYGQDGADEIPGRTLNPHFEVKSIAGLWNDPEMVGVVELLLGVKAMPFQTIVGHKGSQQMAHSDSIHMTTYPQGYLAANWIAFEDIHEDSGPLEYYPGSHKLPYLYSKQIGVSLEEGRGSYQAYHDKYEPAVQDAIKKNGLSPAYFLAKKGDVLLWHANLLHGGSMRRDMQWTRKALVCHYFAEGCICYHDYSGSLSHLHVPPLLAKRSFDASAYLAANPDVAEAGVDAYQHYVDHGHGEGRPLKP